MTENKERLQKVIAKSGVTSRRKAEKYITEGRVKVNGKTVTELGTKVSSSDRVEVDQVELEKEEPVYYMIHKPRGVISAVSDDKGRKVVTDLLPDEIEERLYPVGRLDYDTSGLLLLTNDGEFTQRLIHPKYEMDKVYVAKVNGLVSKEELTQLKKGVVDQGERLKCVKARILNSNVKKGKDGKEGKSIVELTLHQGKNRQVRRMFEALGYRVEKLRRERFSVLELGNLPTGEYRKLTPHEVKQMVALSKQNVK